MKTRLAIKIVKAHRNLPLPFQQRHTYSKLGKAIDFLFKKNKPSLITNDRLLILDREIAVFCPKNSEHHFFVIPEGDSYYKRAPLDLLKEFKCIGCSDTNPWLNEKCQETPTPVKHPSGRKIITYYVRAYRR